MQDKNIQKTKYKLTWLFTIALFCIVFFLGTVFFSFRYFQVLRIDKTTFQAEISQQVKDLSKREDILGFLGLNIGSERVEDFIKRPKNRQSFLKDRPTSFIIVSESGEILEKSIRENIDFEILLDAEEARTQYEDGVFINKQRVSFFLEDATIFFYKRHSYPLSAFLSDVFVFGIFTLFFSSIFYLLSYKFVGRTLRPVEENLSDMRDFIHNAGHELKTPISIIHGNLQIMQAEKKLDSQTIKKSLLEVERIGGLIDSLVELSETGKNSQKENFPLMIEVARIVGEFQQYAQENDVEIHNSVTGKYLLHANKQDLYVVISNILKNSIRYNKKSGKVFITFDSGVLTIRDTGIGITPDAQKKVFERFYQGSSVRSREGFGIGLALVKKVSDVNNWNIILESEEDIGTVFRITF